MKSCIPIILSSLLLCAVPAVAQDTQSLAAQCEACHGPGGHSDQPDIPSLDGRDATELSELLEQFYYYERHCPTTNTRHGDEAGETVNMCGLVNTLSQEEKAALVSYFSGD